MRRGSEAFRRSLDRRRKEDEARRLRDVVPELVDLELDVREARVGMPGHEVHHKRVVVVSRAPALFEFACADRACEGGGHDMTDLVLGHLGRGEARFSGTHRCEGRARETACEYELCFEARAIYRARPLSARGA
ncbi:MAG: hypothetical protein FJ096_07755 [Deltaproteobacteria bacterium]|nr:hypothetical protein [Deltaproteobacteria bacterium]